MADPFQNVDAAGADFIKVFADAMDARQSDPAMEAIVAAYLAQMSFAEGSLTVEVGAGAGAVSRRIAAKARPAKVVGYEPSVGFVAEAKARAGNLTNLSFETADGAKLPLADEAVDNLVMHTVLTHVTAPQDLIAEAHRVLKKGGSLVICDADFSKGTFASFPNDPLDICARAFEAGFVTDPYLVGKLEGLTVRAGFRTCDFRISSRLVRDGPQMLPWVSETTKRMVAAGQIGQPLADALVGEYQRRMEAGTLYGYQAFATLIAERS